MSNETSRPSKDELGTMVYGFLLQNYSQRDREKMINAPTGEGESPCQVAAEALYAKIIESDPSLTKQLTAFTPHEICQVSLVRDVLFTKRQSVAPAFAMAG